MVVKFEIINGKEYVYVCSCKKHTYECLTQEMLDALSEQVYADAK